MTAIAAITIKMFFMVYVIKFMSVKVDASLCVRVTQHWKRVTSFTHLKKASIDCNSYTPMDYFNFVAFSPAALTDA